MPGFACAGRGGTYEQQQKHRNGEAVNHQTPHDVVSPTAQVPQRLYSDDGSWEEGEDICFPFSAVGKTPQKERAEFHSPGQGLDTRGESQTKRPMRFVSEGLIRVGGKTQLYCHSEFYPPPVSFRAPDLSSLTPPSRGAKFTYRKNTVLRNARRFPRSFTITHLGTELPIRTE